MFLCIFSWEKTSKFVYMFEIVSACKTSTFAVLSVCKTYMSVRLFVKQNIYNLPVCKSYRSLYLFVIKSVCKAFTSVHLFIAVSVCESSPSLFRNVLSGEFLDVDHWVVASLSLRVGRVSEKTKQKQ